MAGPRVSQSSGHSCWKQWQRRSPNTCCSKKILLLLVWQALFTFSWLLLLGLYTPNMVLFASTVLSHSFAPLIGWLADVKIGRYKIIKIALFPSFLASLFYYFALFTTKGDSTLTTVLSSIAMVIVSLGYTCFIAAMLPFITDQIIGSTSDELSAVVRWYYWVQTIGIGLANFVSYFCNLEKVYVGSTIIFAIPLALIIISDCLCQQWLDRTHKVTNPVKLIMQVLNYTRKHSYPERRSAFTYIDEEQPTRMDYGKEKFGGPFTEEEVEDVKTFLRFLPLVICLSVSVYTLEISPTVTLFNNDKSMWVMLNDGIESWFFPLLLIPLYQLLLYRCFRSCSPSMLRCIGTGLFTWILGFILLSALGVYGVIVSDDVHRYLSCTALAPNATNPGDYIEWYWKCDPSVLYGLGSTIVGVLVLELIIAQLPVKMKGLVIGIMIACRGFVLIICVVFSPFTLCYDLSISLVLVVLFVVFLVFSKHYTLRERNREINIQAIVEEHYERYMDQEEEYIRENPRYFESLESDSDVYSD